MRSEIWKSRKFFYKADSYRPSTCPDSAHPCSWGEPGNGSGWPEAVSFAPLNLWRKVRWTAPSPHYAEHLCCNAAIDAWEEILHSNKANDLHSASSQELEELEIWNLHDLYSIPSYASETPIYMSETPTHASETPTYKAMGATPTYVSDTPTNVTHWLGSFYIFYDDSEIGKEILISVKGRVHKISVIWSTLRFFPQTLQLYYFISGTPIYDSGTAIFLIHYGARKLHYQG